MKGPALTLFSISLLPLSAIERPPGMERILEEEAKREMDPNPNAKAPHSKRAWLGVGGEMAHQDVAWHLGIAGGVHLRHVIPGSPAAQAGVKAGDILTHLDGERVLEQHDIGNYLRDKKPGEDISLSFIHRGKNQKATATLGEREAAEGSAEEESPWNSERLGEEPAPVSPPSGGRSAGVLTDQFEDLEKQFGLQLHSGGATSWHLQELLEQMDRRMAQGLQGRQGGIGGQQGGFSMQQSGSVDYTDGKGRVTVRMEGESREIRIFDRSGKLLFEGPYTTDEDKAAVPEELRERVARLGLTGADSRSRTFHFRFGDDR